MINSEEEKGTLEVNLSKIVIKDPFKGMEPIDLGKELKDFNKTLKEINESLKTIANMSIW